MAQEILPTFPRSDGSIYGSFCVLARWVLWVTMVLEGRGKFLRPERSRMLLYISTKIADDSQFPFEAGQEVWVRIEGKRLVVEALSEKGKK